MLNPDGVVCGNYRCSLIGRDLNRNWKQPSYILHPVINVARGVIVTLGMHGKLAMFCDFHGHSKK